MKRAEITPSKWLCQLTQLKADVLCRLKKIFIFIAETADTSLQDLPTAPLLHWHKEPGMFPL